MTDTGRPGLRAAALSLLGLRLEASQLEAFETYKRELTDWNRRFNLTAITDPAEVEIKHFLDSLTCLRAMGAKPVGRLIDVGSGAGFPGLPLKIVQPQLDIVLVESVAKKVDFCRHVVGKIGLERVEVVNGRAEALGQDPDHRHGYDWAVARAVAALPLLLEFLLPFVKLGGRAIAQKGDTAPAEVAEAERALAVLGGEVQQLIPLELPQVTETRYLVVIEKTAATPPDYPRRVGIPAKRPIRD